MKSFLRATTATMGIALLAVVGQSLLAGPAGAVTATKVELKAGQLRVEGAGGVPGTNVAVQSTTSVASARVGTDGRYKVESSNFAAADCFLTITDDDTPTATVRIPNCTPSVTPVPPVPAPPTGNCVINAVPPAT